MTRATHGIISSVVSHGRNIQTRMRMYDVPHAIVHDFASLFVLKLFL